jgi:hypothetical protein
MRTSALATSAFGAAPLLLSALAALTACTHTGPGPESRDDSLVEYVPEQQTLAALPLRVRLPANYRAERVLVFYHRWGTQGWDMMELARAGQTWNGEVSCRDVSTVTGETRYFFLAVDAQGHRVTGTGAPEWPHVATVVRAIPDAHALEGEAAPIRCHDPADCPPDFPGCPSYAVKRPSCKSDRDCTRGRACANDGYCDAPPQVAAIDAEHDADDDELLAKAVAAATARYQR